MLVDIAAIPGHAVLEKAIELNHELDQLGPNDILIGGDGIPHVSLLIIDVDPAQVRALKLAVLQGLRVPEDHLAYGSMTQDESSLRVFWNATGNGWNHLHEQSLPLGEAFHTVSSEEMWLKKINRFKPIQMDYIRRYGSPYVCEFFSPHITLARFPTTVDVSSIVVPASCHGVQRIGLFELDEKYRAIREM